jgi:hypothetical protein
MSLPAVYLPEANENVSGEPTNLEQRAGLGGPWKCYGKQ